MMALNGAQTTATYRGERAMRKGIASMQKRGWIVVSQSAYQPRSSLLRVLMLGGIGALVFHPKTRFVVTFAMKTQ